MKFSKVLALEQVEQWKDRYINFYFLKQCISHHIKILRDREFETNAKAVDSLSLRHSRHNKKSSKEEYDSFEMELSNEVAKVDSFFRSRQEKFASRLLELNSEIELMKTGNSSTKRHVDALRNAYHDNHTQWKLLHKFQETNKYGFLKIIKKYDKDFGEEQFQNFMESYLQPTCFWDSKGIEDVLEETKEVYTKYFAASDERLAKSQLRRTDPKRRQQSLFFVALFLGVVLSMFVFCFYSWIRHYPSTPPDFADMGWFVYRMALLPIELGILFSLSSYFWEKYNINYVFIFQFNPAHYRSPLKYLKYGLCALSIWTVSFYLFMDSVIYNSRIFYGILHPLLFVIVLVLAFFLPLPVLGYRTRFYLLKKLVRVLRAGLPGTINVSFSDFIMAIHLMALSEFFLQFQIMFCMFGVRDNNICRGNVYALPILSAIPHWCRMFQCVRRWRQTKQVYPHLASAIRPASTIISLTISALSIQYPEYKWISMIWLVWNIAFGIVRWYSDILIDFGFVTFGWNFSLRKQRLFPTWVYYFVLVDNFCLRYVWLVVYTLRKYTSLNMAHPITLLFLSSFDVIWGFQFVLFRMENEHFNCSDRYNIIQDVPLPFTKKYETLARKNALKNIKREQQPSSAISDIFKGIKRFWNGMPWVDTRKKLRKSISQAILQVDKDHPSLAREPSRINISSRNLTNAPYLSSRNLTNTPYPSSRNLTNTPYSSSRNLNASFNIPLSSFAVVQAEDAPASYALNPPAHILNRSAPRSLSRQSGVHNSSHSQLARADNYHLPIHSSLLSVLHQSQTSSPQLQIRSPLRSPVSPILSSPHSPFCFSPLHSPALSSPLPSPQPGSPFFFSDPLPQDDYSHHTI